MKSTKFALIVSLLTIVLSSCAFAATGLQISYAIAPGSKIWFDATSTLHGFHAASDSVTGTVQIDNVQNATSTGVRSDSISHAAVSLSVTSLKSGDDGLDKNMYKAMEVKKHPEIDYSLDSLMYSPSSEIPGDTVTVEAIGNLSIAGVRKEIRMNIDLLPEPGGKLQITGSKSITMSDFGIKPPTMMFGVIKVGDKVEIHFRLILEPEASSAVAKK